MLQFIWYVILDSMKSCPTDCGGCSCFINAPCSHCTEDVCWDCDNKGCELCRDEEDEVQVVVAPKPVPQTRPDPYKDTSDYWNPYDD